MQGDDEQPDRKNDIWETFLFFSQGQNRQEQGQKNTNDEDCVHDIGSSGLRLFIFINFGIDLHTI